MRSVALASSMLAMVLAFGCKSAGSGTAEVGAAHARGLSGGEDASDKGRCDPSAPGREVSEYDTTGDGQPDVRKVFQRMGTPPLSRLVLICREADLNGDGTKDVVRYYDDSGMPTREEADRDFNGQMDIITYYDGGQIIRQELDRSGDGKVDTKIFYDRGRPLRAERDQAGRSSPGHWKADTWEYYEDGRLVRKGRDLTGDGQVDRWDRNRELKDQLDAQRRGPAGEDEPAEEDEPEDAD
jgi:hypothetical protein